MGKQRKNDAIIALRELGFIPSKRNGSLFSPVEDAHYYKKAGVEYHVKIQVRDDGEKQVGTHQFWFGIVYADFERVDHFVFWAKGEGLLFIVPTVRLREIMEEVRRDQNTASTFKERQWQTTIDFCRRELQPEKYHLSFSLKDYAYQTSTADAG